MNWCVLLRTSDLQHSAQSCVYFAYSSKFPAAADHTDSLHSRVDHCMHSKRMHKL